MQCAYLEIFVYSALKYIYITPVSIHALNLTGEAEDRHEHIPGPPDSGISRSCCIPLGIYHAPNGGVVGSGIPILCILRQGLTKPSGGGRI